MSVAQQILGVYHIPMTVWLDPPLGLDIPPANPYWDICPYSKWVGLSSRHFSWQISLVISGCWCYLHVHRLERISDLLCKPGVWPLGHGARLGFSDTLAGRWQSGFSQPFFWCFHGSQDLNGPMKCLHSYVWKNVGFLQEQFSSELLVFYLN